jgi:hypothetical protein
MSNFPIVPVVNTTTTTVTIGSFTVRCMSLNLFTTATFLVTTFDTNNSLIGNQTITLTPEEYQAWNNDDSYIVNLVAQQLNFTLPTENN